MLALCVLLGACSDPLVAPDRSRGESGLLGSRGIQSIEQGIPESGLLAWLPFNETAEDVWGDRYHAALDGPVFVEDRFGRPNSALQFDGIDDYAVLANGSGLQSLPISISFWVRLGQKTQTSGAITTSFQENHNTGVFLTFDSSTGAPSVSVGNGDGVGHGSRSTLHSRYPLRVGEWNHVVGIVDSTLQGIRMRIFVNGVVPELAYTSGGADPVELENGWGSVTLGRRIASVNSPPLYFKGALDDVGFYDRALERFDVKALFESRGLR